MNANSGTYRLANIGKKGWLAVILRRGAWDGFVISAITALAAEVLLSNFAVEYGTSAELSALSRVVSVTASLFMLHVSARSLFRSYCPRTREALTLCAILVASTVLIWLGMIVSSSLTQSVVPDHQSSALRGQLFAFGIPFAAGPLLLQAVLGSLYGVACSLGLALLCAVYLAPTEVFAPFALVTGLAACLSLKSFRTRSANLRAGFYISLAAIAIAFPMTLSWAPLVSNDILIAITAAFLNGVLCSLLASGFAPVVEHAGGYVTDMRLIEMATIDHPLLKELSVQAPGTWNHSMVMGMMVEAAADSIGANPVLARVGAYFHDIGKMRKPIYFVENQTPGENRHDKLSPSMSALIIRTHVKDGIELARRHGLPQAIEDMIPQHHGTSRIEYFYDKACREAEAEGKTSESVDQSLYRYPGPRPQTKEAGILMLADGVEAAARTLTDPDVDRIQGMVQKMINKVFASGELAECDLTLRDLHLIAKAFTRVLSGIYHQRIAYAEPAEKVREQLGLDGPDSEGSAKKAKAPGGEEGGAKEERRENLKRLGI